MTEITKATSKAMLFAALTLVLLVPIFTSEAHAAPAKTVHYNIGVKTKNGFTTGAIPFLDFPRQASETGQTYPNPSASKTITNAPSKITPFVIVKSTSPGWIVGTYDKFKASGTATFEITQSYKLNGKQYANTKTYEFPWSFTDGNPYGTPTNGPTITAPAGCTYYTVNIKAYISYDTYKS